VTTSELETMQLRIGPSNRRRLTPAMRLLALIVAGVVLVAAVAVLGIKALISTPTNTITVDFTEAPGVYQGNHVDVLGIPIGSVTAVTPHATYVAVTLAVNAGVKVPANAIAALEAPDLVNDRYIQLDPVYTHGPLLHNNAVIPMRRTALPESVDQTISDLDQFIQALGPNGANKTGAVERFIHDVASTVGGNGPSFHTTLTALGTALAALSNDGPNITSILNNVGNFTNVAANNTKLYQSFANDLASVTSLVAADKGDLSTTLSSLQQVMSQVTSFINNNQSALGAMLPALQSFTGQIVAQQQQLGQAFDEGGLVLQNLNNAIVTEPDGSTALNIRYDPSADTPAFVKQICGQELARILNLGLMGAKSPELNLACAASSAIGTVGPEPNESQGPNLTIAALMGQS
jgi:virulence factor Mce-like protein